MKIVLLILLFSLFCITLNAQVPFKHGSFKKGDEVIYLNRIYVAQRDFKGIAVPRNNAYWKEKVIPNVIFDSSWIKRIEALERREFYADTVLIFKRP